MANGTERALELLDGISRAYTRGDWDTLRSLYHDSAMLCTVAAHERIVGPDEVIEIFRSLGATPYAIGETTVAPVDESAVIVSGEVRYPLPSGGVGYGHKAWLLVFKDDLLYRSRPYNSEELALQAYRAQGAELGL